MGASSFAPTGLRFQKNEIDGYLLTVCQLLSVAGYRRISTFP
ncbi:hypothetical protein SAMN04488057_10832 [Cyclobacterium lianum]|uniref:Uncharacterized protein n=1 Tax=Cyclobacterium lianum TaxID=388280 RepID=A0A1M7PCK5_9BACT|nr:hypothetical protein SAMN04488057_10832 [Cyclobacterium lianum]